MGMDMNPQMRTFVRRLSHARCQRARGLAQSKTWRNYRRALDVVGFNASVPDNIFEILAES